MSNAQNIEVKRINVANSPSALKTTIQLIGQGIRAGSQYFPLRTMAARLASRAKPKDYLGQVQHIYNDFVQRWRYVKDPAGVESVVISGPAIMSQVLGVGAPRGERGYGDCDDATVAMGAMLEGIGLPVKIVTTAPPGYPGLFRHVFLQADIPDHGPMYIDPVLYPRAPLGAVASHGRLAVWSLNGDLVSTKGNFPPSFRAMTNQKGAINMSLAEKFPDHDLYEYGLAGADPSDLLDWNEHGVKDFGQYSPELGLIGDASNFIMEYDESDFVGDTGLVVTKSLELAPNDWREIVETGSPRLGAVAFADDGDIYQYQVDPLTGLGFFKKLFRRVKKGVKRIGRGIKKVAKKIGKGVKTLISKLPGGKYLIKLYGKVRQVAKKLVKPLQRLLGSKFGKFLAPIAAFIPGAGPAIAGVIVAMRKAGKIKALLKKFGVSRDKEGKPKFKSGAQAAAFKKSIGKMASDTKKQLAAKKKRDLRRKKRIGKRGKRRGPPKLMTRSQFRRALRRARRAGPKRRLTRAQKMSKLRLKFKKAGWKRGSPRGRSPRGRVYGAGTPEHTAMLEGLGLI